MTENKTNILRYRNFGILVLIFLGIGLYYSFFANAPQIIEHKYVNHVGYLSSDNIDFSENFKRCNDTLPWGFYHSAAPYVYRYSKHAFKKHIHQNFKRKGYLDNGFLNLRFLINCHGEIGDMEINELSTEYQPIDLNDEMVTQLIQLSVREENWNVFKGDTYMYLIYKIENGEVVEILP